ncbi:MAG: AMP-binding protein [Desulfarculaceae bacterium]
MPETDRRQGYYLPDLETMDPQSRQDDLDGKVAEIVAHAYENAQAFKDLMDSVGAKPGDITKTTDLAGIPVTEKGQLVSLQRENLPFGGFAGEKIGKMRRIFASPGPIYEPGEAVYEDTRWTQAFYAAGFRPGDIAQVTFNFNMVPFAFMLDEALHMMDCRSVPTGVGNTELQVQILKDLQVEAYVGTPSFLAALADRAEQMGLDLQKDLNLQVAFVAAEMLPESLRASLQERLGMVIRQSYGTADAGCLSYECYHMEGMHFAQDCVVEVVDPETGQPVGEGEVGEVVTTVFNKTYPLIRFGTGDLSSFTTGTCACGRTSPKLTRIMGRVDQVTKVKGMFVHPSNVQQVAARFSELAAYQLVVTRDRNQDVMTLVCELTDESVDQSQLRVRLQTAMKETLRVSGQVEFATPGTLPEDCKTIDDRRTWD